MEKARLKRSADQLLDGYEPCVGEGLTLDSGTFGTVKQLSCSTELVVKESAYFDGQMGDPRTCPFRSEQLEPHMIHVLNTHLVDHPHIVTMYGSPVVNQRGVAFCMERAEHKDLRSYLHTLMPGQEFVNVCRIVLFQVAYTLASIYAYFPWFRHNDLTDRNVLVKTDVHGTRGTYTYTVDDTTFHVPAIGICIKVADFDYASIADIGMVNYKLLEMEWDSPAFSFGTRVNHAIDIGTFVRCLRSNHATKFTAAFARELNGAFHGTLRGGEKPYNRNYVHPGVVTSSPTVHELLASSLFDCFKEPSGAHVLDSYSVCSGDVVFPAIHFERRYCPILVPLPHLRVYDLYASAPLASDVEDEQGMAYSPKAGDRILNTLKHAYLYEPFDFEREDEREFFAAVRQRAMDFLTAHPQPFRWWAAVFTAVFYDVAYEMALFREAHSCWYFAQWCEFWTKHRQTAYTPEQLLHFYMQWTWIN